MLMLLVMCKRLVIRCSITEICGDLLLFVQAFHIEIVVGVLIVVGVGAGQMLLLLLLLKGRQRQSQRQPTDHARIVDERMQHGMERQTSGRLFFSIVHVIVRM